MSSGVYSYLWRGIFSQLETPFGIVGILQHFRELMLSGLHHTKLEPSIWEHFSLKRELNNITFWTMWSRSSWSYFKIIIKQVMEHYKTNVLLLDTFIFRYLLHQCITICTILFFEVTHFIRFLSATICLT